MAARKIISRKAPSGRKFTLNPKVARRSFMKIAAAVTALTGLALSGRLTKEAEAKAKKSPYSQSKIVRTICTYCSVGCGIYAEVENDVWVRQEIAQDHPVSRGGHCCKGAGAIDMVNSEKRLKYPLKRQNGRWVKISWEQAMDEICSKLLDIRKKYGPDAVHWNGSAKVSTEMAYLQRKLAAFWGTNNIDHQARI
ncbi:formate dehydrogenase [Thermodesulfatator autotrophicus]|nr:formate dehydrogenase [Thermodesulfatator autotrophicus]